MVTPCVSGAQPLFRDSGAPRRLGNLPNAHAFIISVLLLVNIDSILPSYSSAAARIDSAGLPEYPVVSAFGDTDYS